MAYAVQQNVTGQKLRFLLVDSITHIPGVAGLDTSTFTLWLSKAGGVLAATAGGPVYEEGRGWYHYVCQAADLDTAGVLGLSISAPGCDPCDVEFFVTAYDPTVTTPVGAGSFIAQMQARGIGTGLTTTQWNQVYADALAMYSRYRPRTLLSTLTTVAGQEFYDLPTGGNLVKAVAPWGVYSEFQDIGLSVDEAMLQAAIGGGYTFAFDLPSLTDLYHQKLEAIIRQWGGSFDQDPSGGKVRLLPRPTDVETLAVLYTAGHADLTTVNDGDLDLVLMAGDACALATLSLGTAVSVIGSGGRLTLGAYTRDTGSLGTLAAALLTRADAAEKRFLDHAQATAPAIKG